MTRIFPLSYCRLKGIRRCFLSREVGRGSLLLSDAVAKELTRDLFHKKRPSSSFFLGQGKKRSRRKGVAPSLLAKQKTGAPLSLQKQGKSFTSSLNKTLKLFVVNQKRAPPTPQSAKRDFLSYSPGKGKKRAPDYLLFLFRRWSRAYAQGERMEFPRPSKTKVWSSSPPQPSKQRR